MAARKRARAMLSFIIANVDTGLKDRECVIMRGISVFEGRAHDIFIMMVDQTKNNCSIPDIVIGFTEFSQVIII